MAMYRRRPSDERALCLMVLGWRRWQTQNARSMTRCGAS